MLAYPLAALLLRPCPPISPAQAQAVAIRFIKRRYSSVLFSYPPFKTYPFSRQQMQAYAREGSRVESGYLVMYTLLLLLFLAMGALLWVVGRGIRNAYASASTSPASGSFEIKKWLLLGLLLLMLLGLYNH